MHETVSITVAITILIALAGVVFTMGKYVATIDRHDKAREKEAEHIAQIPTILAKLVTFEGALSALTSEQKKTREEFLEHRTETTTRERVRSDPNLSAHVPPHVSAMRPGRGGDRG